MYEIVLGLLIISGLVLLFFVVRYLIEEFRNRKAEAKTHEPPRLSFSLFAVFMFLLGMTILIFEGPTLDNASNEGEIVFFIMAFLLMDWLDDGIDDEETPYRFIQRIPEWLQKPIAVIGILSSFSLFWLYPAIAYSSDYFEIFVLTFVSAVVVSFASCAIAGIIVVIFGKNSKTDEEESEEKNA